MKNLFAARISIGATNFSLLFLRVTTAILMIPHGYEKLTQFSEMKMKFVSFMGLSPAVSLGMAIFAELFCSALLMIGLLTRLAAIPLVINMSVAVFMAHAGDIFGKGQTAALLLIVYLTLLFTGPGAYSVDRLINKK
jgi:putative oxidoreductase